MERSKVMRGCGVAAALAGGLAMVASFVLCAGVWGGGAAMNAGPVDIPIGPEWKVDGKVGRAGPIAAALREKCVPMTNGLHILFTHAWYNAITDGYDARIWLEDPAGYGSVGLYAWGNHVFVRDEVARDGYVNRVLDCEMDAAELQKIAGG